MTLPHADRFTWQKSSYSTGTGGNCVEVGVTWRKSSYSGGNGGACVEVGVTWHKSAYSGGTGGDCVEVATAPEYVGIRDTKSRDVGHLTVTPAAWRTFVRSITR